MTYRCKCLAEATWLSRVALTDQVTASCDDHLSEDLHRELDDDRDALVRRVNR